MTLLLTTSAVERRIDPEDWPRCALCDMPVEQFCVTETGDALTFVAVCHGDREVVTVPTDVLEEMTSWMSLDIGPAFARKEIA